MNMMTDKPYAIGVDIGGTNTVFGIVDKRGQILKMEVSKLEPMPK